MWETCSSSGNSADYFSSHRHVQSTSAYVVACGSRNSSIPCMALLDRHWAWWYGARGARRRIMLNVDSTVVRLLCVASLSITCVRILSIAHSRMGIRLGGLVPCFHGFAKTVCEHLARVGWLGASLIAVQSLLNPSMLSPLHCDVSVVGPSSR